MFVRGALPGERVRARVVEEHRDYARAELVEVVSAAPSRCRAPCRFVAEGCGGCNWQHVEPAAQAELKVAIVADALRRGGGLPDAVVEAGPALPTTGFRTTLRMGVDGDGRLGFRAARSHDLVAVASCLVAHPLLDELVAGARFPGATEVVLRCGAATGERSALVEPVACRRGRRRCPPTCRRGPKAFVHEIVAGVRFRVSARSFFQTRQDGAEALVAAVATPSTAPPTAVSWSTPTPASGCSPPRSVDPDEVVAVESSRSAAADARGNLAGRTADRGRRRRRPLAPPHRPTSWSPTRPAPGSAAGPPRCSPRHGRDRFVLVSCDAASLARDARLLGDLGYEHVRSTVVDLFPHTAHVEVVTRFDRR